MTPRLLLLLLLLAPATTHAGEQTPSELPAVLDDDPVEVEGDCTWVSGDFDSESSPLCTGTCRWHDVPPEKVVAILERRRGWARAFRSLIRHEELGDGRAIQVFRARPFRKRQVTLRITVVETEAGGYHVGWTRAKQQEPLDEDRVTIPVYDGWWEVQPDGNGGSIVTHGARFDPGPDIPRKFVKFGMPRQVRRLLKELRSAVDDSR